MPLIIFIILILLLSPAFAKETSFAEIGPFNKQEGLYNPFIVERVIDGDTIVASGKKIRIWGINAPEKKEQLFDFSKNFLDEFLKNKRIDCKLIDFDKYKRQVMHCYADVIDIGSMMVMLGLARDYTKYSGGFYQREQENAQSKLLGIWKIAAGD